MSVRFVKHPTVESGVFNSTNNRMRVKIQVGPGNAYNMKDSYAIFNITPDGNGVKPDNTEAGSGDPVFSWKFGNQGGDEYLPSCVIRHCKLISEKKGILESNIERNLWNQTMSKYMHDKEQFDSMKMYGFGSEVDKEYATYANHFLNIVNNGNIKSSQRAANVIIPLSDFFELGKQEVINYNEVGDLEMEFELETLNQVFTDNRYLHWDNTPSYACADITPSTTAEQKTLRLSQNYSSVLTCPFTKSANQKCIIQFTSGGNVQHVITTIDAATDFTRTGGGIVTILMASNVFPQAACTNITVRKFNDGLGLAGNNSAEVVQFANLASDGKVLTTQIAMSTSNTPFYVGMPITITYLDATPEQQVTRRMITKIEVNGGDATKLDITVDGTDDIPVCSQVYAQQTQSKAQIDGTGSPRPIINRADIVIVEEKGIPKTPIQYEKIMVEAFNLPAAVSYFEKVYQLDAGTQRIVLMNKYNDLLSEIQQLSNYRLYYDNKSNTDRNVVVREPLYYDRILRAFGGDVKCLEEVNNDHIIADLVLSENPAPMLQVQMQANNGQNLGTGGILYLFKLVPTML